MRFDSWKLCMSTKLSFEIHSYKEPGWVNENRRGGRLKGRGLVVIHHSKLFDAEKISSIHELPKQHALSIAKECLC